MGMNCEIEVRFFQEHPHSFAHDKASLNLIQRIGKRTQFEYTPFNLTFMSDSWITVID